LGSKNLFVRASHSDRRQIHQSVFFSRGSSALALRARRQSVIAQKPGARTGSGDCPVSPLARRQLKTSPGLCALNRQKPQPPSLDLVGNRSPAETFFRKFRLRFDVLGWRSQKAPRSGLSAILSDVASTFDETLRTNRRSRKSGRRLHSSNYGAPAIRKGRAIAKRRRAEGGTGRSTTAYVREAPHLRDEEPNVRSSLTGRTFLFTPFPRTSYWATFTVRGG